jgi:predicted enzyme related to lactoylglutathione lyase
MIRPPRLAYVTVSSTDAARLTEFYRELTSTEVTFAAGAYTVIGDGGEVPALAFQAVAADQPVGPPHVDFHVDDLEAAEQHVLALGGRLGETFDEVGSVWRQAFDPDGNVFCLMGRSASAPDA